MTIEEIEMYHDMGLMPDYAYYQQNGKSATENWNKQNAIFKKRYKEDILKEQYQDELENNIKKTLEDVLEGLLTDKKIDFNLQI